MADSEHELSPSKEELTHRLSKELRRVIALDKWKRDLDDEEDDYKLCHYCC
jgi:hypothetical protein